MNTFVHGAVRFHHHNKLDGDVLVMVPKSAIGEPVITAPGGTEYIEVTIDGAALKALVLDWLRSEAVGKLETASDDELACLLTNRLTGARD